MSEGPYGIGSTTWPGLAKTIEECGEVLQVLGKIIARGGHLNHRWPCPECKGDPKYTVSIGMGAAGPCQECLGKGYLGSGDLTDKVHEELGDLKAAIDFLISHNPQLDADAIEERQDEKTRTYQRWHRERIVAP